jgi:hypothetical protein
MAEWFKAAVLKTVDRKIRGFESLSLRHATSTPTIAKIIACWKMPSASMLRTESAVSPAAVLQVKREFESSFPALLARAEIDSSPSAPRNDNVLLRVIASEAKQSRDNL